MLPCGEKWVKCNKTKKITILATPAKISPLRVYTSQKDRIDVLTPSLTPAGSAGVGMSRATLRYDKKNAEDHISITLTINGDIEYIFERSNSKTPQ